MGDEGQRRSTCPLPQRVCCSRIPCGRSSALSRAGEGLPGSGPARPPLALHQPSPAELWPVPPGQDRDACATGSSARHDRCGVPCLLSSTGLCRPISVATSAVLPGEGIDGGAGIREEVEMATALGADAARRRARARPDGGRGLWAGWFRRPGEGGCIGIPRAGRDVPGTVSPAAAWYQCNHPGTAWSRRFFGDPVTLLPIVYHPRGKIIDRG